MKFKSEFPPNFDLINKHFPYKVGVIFTHGDTLYAPYIKKESIPDDLWAHEETHTTQQGDDPDEWWKKYILDKKFRYEQELEAYRNQYQYAVENYTRQRKKQLLKRIAKDLSSPIYGSIVSFEKAKEDICLKQ